MTKEEIEKLFNIKLDKNSHRKDQILYGEDLYLYKRELKQDYYFTFKTGSPEGVYKIPFNTENYNPMFTETGKSADSFKLNFKECLESGKIIKISLDEKSNLSSGPIVDRSISIGSDNELASKVDAIILSLLEIKNELLRK